MSLTAGGAQEDAKQATLLQYQSTLANLETAAPAGRMVVHISSNMQRWANTPMDVQVRGGDSFFVPKRPNIVIVNGTVYNPTAITYKPGKRGWYLKQAGGPTNCQQESHLRYSRRWRSGRRTCGPLHWGGRGRSSATGRYGCGPGKNVQRQSHLSERGAGVADSHSCGHRS